MRQLTVIATSFVVLMGCGTFLDPDSRRDGLEGTEVTIENPGSVTTCVYPPPQPVLTGNGHAVDLRECTKIEGGDLGEALTLDVDGAAVTIDGWRNKEGEGEFIGFVVEGNVTVVVKAGTELFESGPGEWVHPAGTEGPRAKGISFVAFCGPGDGGGYGEGEPECTTITGDPGDGTTQPNPDDGGGSSDPGGDYDDGGSGECETMACTPDSSCADFGTNAVCANGCCARVIM